MGAMRFTASERLIRASTRLVNTRPALKRLAHAYLRTVGMNGVHLVTRHLLQVRNAEVLDTLPRDRGLLVASNHRSFFDMYVVSSVMLRRCPWLRRLYFPVRSEYFYERIDALLLNGFVAGMSMYPPVYRDAARRPLNRAMVDFLVAELQRPGTLVGLHPEGQRGLGDDPFTLLPAQPGIGDIAHRARPVVLPVFITGLRNQLTTQVRDNFRRSGPPIMISFGAPATLDSYFDAPAGSRQALRIAQAIRGDIEALGSTLRRSPASPHA